MKGTPGAGSTRLGPFFCRASDEFDDLVEGFGELIDGVRKDHHAGALTILVLALKARFGDHEVFVPRLRLLDVEEVRALPRLDCSGQFSCYMVSPYCVRS